jgi:hypothetical protein
MDSSGFIQDDLDFIQDNMGLFQDTHGFYSGQHGLYSGRLGVYSGQHGCVAGSRPFFRNPSFLLDDGSYIQDACVLCPRLPMCVFEFPCICAWFVFGCFRASVGLMKAWFGFENLSRTIRYLTTF